MGSTGHAGAAAEALPGRWAERWCCEALKQKPHRLQAQALSTRWLQRVGGSSSLGKALITFASKSFTRTTEQSRNTSVEPSCGCEERIEAAAPHQGLLPGSGDLPQAGGEMPQCHSLGAAFTLSDPGEGQWEQWGRCQGTCLLKRLAEPP